MKNFFVISLAGIMLGTIFALYMFSNINESVAMVIKEENIATAFQVGVFSIYENALKVTNTYEDAYIYQDEDKYRVFLAIYQSPEIIKIMHDYYKTQNIDIYLKKITVNSEFFEELKNYEKLLNATNNINTYIKANKNILGAYKDSLWAI